MRIFGSDRMGGMLQRLGLQEGEAIVHPWINKALEKAQKKVETRNFDMRKNVLKYDDVMNDQRKEVYAQRREFMRSESVSAVVAEMREDVIAHLVAMRIPERAFAEQWQTAELTADLKRLLGLDLPVADWAAEEGIDETGIRERVVAAAEAAAEAKRQRFGAELTNYVEKSVLLQTLDHVWKEHLLALDYLRQGIGLRSYGQRDPLNEYKREAFALFNALLDELKERVTNVLAHVTVGEAPPAPPPPPPMVESHPVPAGMTGELALAEPVLRADAVRPYREEDIDPDRPETWAATPRNAACPCGSGKKYKYCHGKV
jgi:preprotein translocase subunit SecA